MNIVNFEKRCNEEIILEGTVKPYYLSVGTAYQPKTRHDKFGKIPKGCERIFWINTLEKKSDGVVGEEWTQIGQFFFPRRYANKKVKLVITTI